MTRTRKGNESSLLQLEWGEGETDLPGDTSPRAAEVTDGREN